MNEFCSSISHGSVVKFFRCGGHVHSHCYNSFYSDITQIIRSTKLAVLLKMTFWNFQLTGEMDMFVSF